MGGPGSTRWLGHSKKLTVEACSTLDANRFMQKGVFRESIHRSGIWSWQSPTTGEITSSLGYEVDTTDLHHSWIRLSYTITRSGEGISYKIELATTRPNFGGLRWWFICPLSVNGHSCYRRVGKIYLPPYAHYYGCRHCYDLTYTSAQEADKRVYNLRCHPDELMDIINNRDTANPSKLYLAMKALKGRTAWAATVYCILFRYSRWPMNWS